MAGPMYLTVPEVADRYRVSTSTVYYWLKCRTGVGALSIKRGRRRLWSITVLDKYDTDEGLADGGVSAA